MSKVDLSVTNDRLNHIYQQLDELNGHMAEVNENLREIIGAMKGEK